VARGKPADELAALEARYQERVDEIEALFQEQLEDWQGWNAGAAGAEAARTGTFWFPTDLEQAAREREAALARLEPLRRRIEELAEERLPGRPRGSGKLVPLETFWEIFRLALEGTPAYVISQITDDNPTLDFVYENKVGFIVRWIKANPAEARRALDSRIIPSSFPGKRDGVLIPMPETA
jgi:hypothetical protein